MTNLSNSFTTEPLDLNIPQITPSTRQIQTESIKYAGSKAKLIPQILQIVKEVEVKKVWDAFSGSTRVSQAFAQAGYRVESNDLAVWSEQLATAYLKNQKHPQEYERLIDYLNNLPPTDGWFTENYGGKDLNGSSVQEDGLKKVWQIHNTRKLDSIREEIDKLDLDPITRAVALTSLMQALDRVDSSLGHFTSYLRKWSARSYNSLQLKVPRLWPNTDEHIVTRKDVLLDCKPLSPDVDLAYFDPPYGSNNEKMPASRVRYQSYYHLWTTVVKNDRPELFGAAKRRVDTSDRLAVSPFEEFRKNEETNRYLAVEAIDKLISETPTPWILLSYSNGGRATASELDEVLRKNGELIKTVTVDHKRNVMAEMRWTHDWIKENETKNQEFLFLLKK